jgi:ABC-type polysaccharide/polyol phosphate export permease
MLGTRWAHLAMLNPLTGILEGLRLSIVSGHNLTQPLTTLIHGVETPVWEPWELVYSAVCAIGGVIGSTMMFRKLQPLFAEFI